jgi:hypothetical protein
MRNSFGSLGLFLFFRVIYLLRSEWIVCNGRLCRPSLPADNCPLPVVYTLVDVGFGEVAVPSPADHIATHDAQKVTLFDGHVCPCEAKVLCMYRGGALHVHKHFLPDHDLGNYFL